MSCVFIKTDVSKEDDIKAAVDLAVEKFGSLDILVAFAGIGGAIVNLICYGVNEYRDYPLSVEAGDFFML